MSLHSSSAIDTPPHRILLVEDHAIVREGIAAIFATFPSEFIVCGQADTSHLARELVTQAQPHLIVLDYFLGDGDDGARLIGELKRLRESVRILVLSLIDENDLAERALRAGAHGYLVKTQGTARLLDACRAVLAGGLYVTPELQARLLDRLSSENRQELSSCIQALTERELQILQFIGSNLPVESIAKRLGLSPRTILAHRENIKNKLGYDSADALGKFASGWVRNSRL